MEHLAILDWVVLAIYAGLLVAIGVYTGRKEKNTEDYFLGGRKMPWWAVMLSIYATSLSALTFIGVPGVAYKGDFLYLQLGLGDFFGRILIAFLLLTAYYKARVTTVYELLGQRFGPQTHNAGTLFFLITRLFASGVRLAGCAIALSVVFDVPLNMAIALIALVALIYTMLGGIKAVIWTDGLQFILFMGAAIIALGTIMLSLEGGFSEFLQIGNSHNKFTIIHFSTDPAHKDYWLNFGNPQALLAGFFFGCLSVLAALGTDQDLVQRMLTCEKVEQSQRALLLTAILNFPVTLLFLSVGAALFVYYQQHPNVLAIMYGVFETDKIFPFFIKTVLAPGLRGLLIAGLLAAAMSSLDSALNALASTAYVDIYKRYINPNAKDDIHAVSISRRFVVLFAVILAVLAMFFGDAPSILWLGFRMVGYTYGALLGIFLLAVLTKNRGNDFTNFLAMITSVEVVFLLTSDTIYPLVAWPWAICIGTVWTFVFAALFTTKKD